MLLTWTAWQVGSGYCTTIADALAHLRCCPPGNVPLEFIFGDLLTRFTPEDERIIATSCCWPPESSPGVLESFVGSPTAVNAAVAFSCRSFLDIPRYSNGSSTFSSALVLANRLNP